MNNNFSPETRLADITAGQFEEILTRVVLATVEAAKSPGVVDMTEYEKELLKKGVISEPILS